MPNYHLLAAGSDASRDDYKTLINAERRRSSPVWSALKELKEDDFVLIYCQAPHSAIVATARACWDARKGVDYRYETELKEVRMLKDPITLAELRKIFPKWIWTKKARGQVYLERETGKALWRRAARIEASLVEEALAAKIVKAVGAGFGTSENNKRVEQAAIAYATRHFKKQGFQVKSRERENIGYDLEVSKGKKAYHVEVKGISGSRVRFPITSGEVNTASQDSSFQLMVVTCAGTPKEEHQLYDGGQFQKLLRLKPLAYMAELK